MADMSTGTRYTDEQKEKAFQVWCFSANRSAAETARVLLEDPDESFTVTRQTIHKWSIESEWHRRADRDLFAGAPRFRYATQTELILAAPEAARLVRRMMVLDDSLKTEAWVDTVAYDEEGKAFRAKERAMVFDDKLLKLRLGAAQLVLDRTGFSPIGTKEGLGSIDPPPTMDSVDRKQIEDAQDHDELRRLEREIQGEFGIGRRN